ncbi:MAG: hypothetical protein ACI8RZ_006564 [Myxococcota bacterium]|jgi:hypothetical protein
MDEFNPKLAHFLHGLLNQHGIPAQRDEARITIERTGATLTLRLIEDRTPGWALMGITAQRPGQPLLRDVWVGLGATLTEAVRDGIGAFCRQDFHVLLASHGGVLEVDQVEHAVIVKDGQTWDLYCGPWVGRSRAGGGIAMDLDLTTLSGLFESQARSAVHSGRLFVSTSDGKVTSEAMLDGVSSPVLLDALKAATGELPDTGYASRRLFFAGMLRGGEEPVHAVVRECAGAPG